VVFTITYFPEFPFITCIVLSGFRRLFFNGKNIVANSKVIGKKNNSLKQYTWWALGFRGEEMGTSASDKEKSQESQAGKTKAIVIGIVLTIIGSLIASAYAKETIPNYIGFIMLLVGIAAFVIGVVATGTAYLKTRLCQETPVKIGVKTLKILCLSIWSLGIGVVLAVVGSILGSAYAEGTIINEAGYWSLLTGTGVFLFGVAGTAIISLKRRPKRSGVKGAKRRGGFSNILFIGIAVALVIAGFIVAGSYAKESLMNYVGFATLLTGIAGLSAGVAKMVVAILKNRVYPDGKVGGNKPRLIFGSIWAMSIGLMLLINGSLIAGSYEKNSIMNCSGFGMLLAGTSVFVYGLFETARISATGYFSKRSSAHVDMERVKKKEKLSVRLKKFGRNLVKTSAVINLIGVMVGIGLLFFSLWQLDIIVSGPLWWEYSPTGPGWHWDGPGAYARTTFQCTELWITTIGQAYDTLFMLIFISFIVVFASAFFWPRGRGKDNA
jgi:hypothetical protein